MDKGKLLHYFQKYRWTLVLVLLAALFVVGHVTGLTEKLEIEQVKTWVRDAGPWGVVLFVGLFVVGELVHVPGLVFVAAAMYVYGEWQGVMVSLGGAVVSVTVSFLIIRFVGGQPLHRIRWNFIRRMLAHLDERPITVVFLLRVVLWLAPVVNYVLAMSRVRFRDYLIGSALGLAIPVTGFALLFDYLKQFW